MVSCGREWRGAVWRVEQGRVAVRNGKRGRGEQWVGMERLVRGKVRRGELWQAKVGRAGDWQGMEGSLRVRYGAAWWALVWLAQARRGPVRPVLSIQKEQV